MSLRLHGPQMIELKARLPLSAGARQRLDLFFYLPEQLQLDARTLPRDRFLSGVVTHSRYQVRREGLDILTSTDDDNPLVRITALLDDAGYDAEAGAEAGGGGNTGDTPADADRIRECIYELRMAGNLFHSAFKDELRAAAEAPPVAAVVDRADAALAAVGTVCRRILDGSGASPSSECRQAVVRMREYVWSTTIRRTARTILDGDLSPEDTATLRPWLRRLEDQAADWGFEPLAGTTDTLRRDGELKRWIQSILYLPARGSRRNDRVFQVVAAVAAGLAMTVAVLATVFANSRWAGGSLPWAIALVGAYIVKDRIKEGVRVILVRRVPGLVQDRVTLLSEPVDVALRHTGGTARRVPSVRRRTIGRKVAMLRFVDAPAGWTGVQLQKRFRFRMRRVRRHRRANAVVEIIRIDVGDWLARLDREWKYWPVRGADGSLRLARVPREYDFYAAVRQGEMWRWYRIRATREAVVGIAPSSPLIAEPGA